MNFDRRGIARQTEIVRDRTCRKSGHGDGEGRGGRGAESVKCRPGFWGSGSAGWKR